MTIEAAQLLKTNVYNNYKHGLDYLYTGKLIKSSTYTPINRTYCLS